MVPEIFGDTALEDTASDIEPECESPDYSSYSFASEVSSISYGERAPSDSKKSHWTNRIPVQLRAEKQSITTLLESTLSQHWSPFHKQLRALEWRNKPRREWRLVQELILLPTILYEGSTKITPSKLLKENRYCEFSFSTYLFWFFTSIHLY